MEINPINPKAKWKKLFAREYAVQYTEISLRCLSPEVRDIVPAPFYEQIYVPEENNQVCYADDKKWNNFIAAIQKKYVLRDARGFEKIFVKTGNQYVNYCRKISKINLSKKSYKELANIYDQYQKTCVRYTFFIWAAYFLNEFAAERARNLVEAKAEKEKMHGYLDAVLVPLKRAAILELTHIVSTEKLNENKIKKLYKKYSWIPCLDIQNNPWSLDEFRNHLSDFRKNIQKTRMSYNAAIKKLKISKKEKCVLDDARLFAYIKDSRDDFRRKGIFYIQNSLFKELSDRLRIEIHDLAYLTEDEIKNCLIKKLKADKNSAESRKKGFVVMYDNEKNIICLSGSQIKDGLKALGLIKESVSSNLQGTPASRGTSQGKVAIVKGVKDLPNVNKGDIIVAVTTHPDYVPAMQKAAAIVTDEGGVTSHAAIVSREIGIPCIVGTKNATKTLQNGDFVEVDGNTGSVRILNKKN